MYRIGFLCFVALWSLTGCRADFATPDSLESMTVVSTTPFTVQSETGSSCSLDPDSPSMRCSIVQTGSDPLDVLDVRVSLIGFSAGPDTQGGFLQALIDLLVGGLAAIIMSELERDGILDDILEACGHMAAAAGWAEGEYEVKILFDPSGNYLKHDCVKAE